MNPNQAVNVNTSYILFSPFIAAQQSQIGFPVQGCQNWTDLSKMNTNKCISYVGLTCSNFLNNPFSLGITDVDSALLIQFSPVDSTVSDVAYGQSYNITSVDPKSYNCTTSPSPSPLTINNSIVMGGYSSGSFTLGDGLSVYLITLNTDCTTPVTNCQLNASTTDVEWIVYPTTSANAVVMGDLIQLYNPTTKAFMAVQDMTWGGMIPNEEATNMFTTQPAQFQQLLYQLPITSYDSMNFQFPDPNDPTLFQVIPTNGVMPLSYLPFKNIFTSTNICPCPLSQCPGSLCNTGNLLYFDPVGGQSCPVICQYDPLTTSCSFSLDPNLCSQCKSFQCGQCPKGQLCARDLNSGNCQCVPSPTTTQQQGNRAFLIYILLAAIFVTLVLGGGYILWQWFSHKYAGGQKAKAAPGLTIDQALLQVTKK